MKALLEKTESGYRATTISFPFSAEGKTQEEAIARLQKKISAADAEIIDVAVRTDKFALTAFGQTVAESPAWQKLQGDLKDMSAEDFESWQESIKEYRRQKDAEEGL